MPTNKNVLPHREKWIGGSDMPTILEFDGATKYGHSWEKLVLSKLGLSKNKFNGNKHTAFGHIIEEKIRQHINQKYNSVFLEKTAYDKKRKYRANCDGYNGVLLIEIKTYSYYNVFDWEYYLAQCQFYCEVFNCDNILIIAYKKQPDFCVFDRKLTDNNRIIAGELVKTLGKNFEVVEENDRIYVFDTELVEENISIYKIKRDKKYFDAMEEKIVAFKKYFKKRKDEIQCKEKRKNVKSTEV